MKTVKNMVETHQQVMLRKLDIHMQKNKVESLLYAKINLKKINNLNVRPKTIKLLRKKLGEKLQDLRFCFDTLHMTLET